MTAPRLPDGHRVVVSQLGDDPLQVIEDHAALVAQPAPDVATLGAREVVIAIESAGVGWVDLLMTSGQYQHAARPPYTPGLEYSGRVAWAGREVTHVRAGDRVLVDGFLAGPRSSGSYRDGGFASYGVAPAEAVHPIPGELSFDQAACLLGNYETAYHCLVTRGRLAAGETVLIHGASGATGLAAVHVAKLVGARVIATGRSATKLEVVRAEGADHTVELGALRDQVKALTDGRGVEVVYDGIGGDVSIESLRCLTFGGRFLIVGWASTPFVARDARPNQLPTNLIMMKGLDVLGCPTVISTAKDPALRPPRLAQIFAWARAGQLRPRVSRVFALAEFGAALRAKWHSDFVGNCVVHPR
jgi:NADPH:quinone reductase